MLIDDALLRARAKTARCRRRTILLITPIPAFILPIAAQRRIDTTAILTAEIVRATLFMLRSSSSSTQLVRFVATVAAVVDAVAGERARYAFVVRATETGGGTGDFCAECRFLVGVVGAIVLTVADEERIDAETVVATETVLRAGVAAIGLVGTVGAIGVTVASPLSVQM